MKIAPGVVCAHVWRMANGLRGLSRSSLIHRLSVGWGGHVHPTAQQSFGVRSSEEGGKAVPASCRKCLLWPLLSEAVPSLVSSGAAHGPGGSTLW